MTIFFKGKQLFLFLQPTAAFYRKTKQAEAFKVNANNNDNNKNNDDKLHPRPLCSVLPRPRC